MWTARLYEEIVSLEGGLGAAGRWRGPLNVLGSESSTAQLMTNGKHQFFEGMCAV